MHKQINHLKADKTLIIFIIKSHDKQVNRKVY